MNDVTIVIVCAKSESRDRLQGHLNRSAGASRVTVAGSGHSGLELIANLRPDIAFIDSDLPGLSGMAITAVVRRDFPETAVVLLTRIADFDWLLASSRCGASTALARDASAEDILRTLDDAFVRQAKLFPWAVRDEELERSSFGGGWNRDRIDHVLTRQSVAVLDCMVMGLNHAEMKSALGTTMYGLRGAISDVITAMDSEGKIQAIVSAIERGWCTISARPFEVSIVKPASAPVEHDPCSEQPRILNFLHTTRMLQDFAYFG